jgi:hypothetical protein
MNRLLLKLATAATIGSLVSSNATVAQVLPPTPKAACVEITQGPALELALDDFAIIRWTTNNPGGSDDHFGVVHYGTEPERLSQMAKSPSGSTGAMQRRFSGCAWWACSRGRLTTTR